MLQGELLLCFVACSAIKWNNHFVQCALFWTFRFTSLALTLQKTTAQVLIHLHRGDYVAADKCVRESYRCVLSVKLSLTSPQASCLILWRLANCNVRRCLSLRQSPRLQWKRRLRSDGDTTAGLRRARRGPGLPRLQLSSAQVHGQWRELFQRLKSNVCALCL